MSGVPPEGGRLQAIVGAGRLVGFVVSPPTGGWDLPRAAVATWVLTHFCVVSVLAFATVTQGLGRSQLTAAVVILVWLVLASGLCARLLRALVTQPSDRPLRLPDRSGLPWEFKLGLFGVASYAALVASQTMGWGVEAVLLATLSITTGLRLAGLDALAGEEHPPLHYVRTVFSAGGALAFGCLVVVAGLVFALTGFFVDPRLAGMEQTVEEWLGLPFDRWSQFRTMVIGLLLLTPVVTGVCEAVSAVSRYEGELLRRIADHEQGVAREDIARDLHDSDILSLLERARREEDDARRTGMLVMLELRLRRLQVDRHQPRQARSVRACLRRPLHGANVLGLSVQLVCDAATLDAVLNPETAGVLERLIIVQINNSCAAGAQSAEIRLASNPNAVRVAYVDDGGGFDPAAVDDAGGGMSRLRFDIERMGGRLWFERAAGATTVTARVPGVLVGAR